jgi:hypothetical protein
VKAALALCVCIALTAGCSSSSHISTPTIQAARTFALAGFAPSEPVGPGKPTTLHFFIREPSGARLVRYRRGAGPHTGVHVIVVRDDLASIVHQHPPITANGDINTTVTFPAPGHYRVLVDAYPALSGTLRNFQLFKDVTVTGPAATKPVPPFRPVDTVDGFRVSVTGAPKLHAIQAAFVNVVATDPNGRAVQFTPWFGAIAHAIFFRAGSLAYFHTHVCGPTTPACAGAFGATAVSGTSTQPGRLHVGILLPQSGTWRMFLQFKAGRKIITAPFTLRVQ